MENFFTHLPEILSAVALVLGYQKGYEIYQRKQFKNGNSRDRRSNSFCESDKVFIRECFNDHSEKLTLSLKTDRLELLGDLKDFIRDDGESTRTTVRAG